MGVLRSNAGLPVAMDDLCFDFEAEIDTKDALRRASLKADGVNSTADNASTRGRHSIVCKHWLRNLCMKGDKCDFLHQYDPNRMPECTFWLKFGKCSDPECIFRHVNDNERPECQRYRLGFCRYGLMCRSRHDRLPRDALPELLPDWFLNSLIVNPYLIPRSDDLPLSDFRDRLRNGSRGNELALVPAESTAEQGTIPGLLPPIHGKCRYYVMRSMNVRNIQISAAKGIWASSLGNTQKLRQAFQDVDHIILIFSATESRTFSGYGKMMSGPDDTLFPGIWGELSARLSPNFRVHWIKQCTAPLGLADHIKNPQNDDSPVRRCRDGQELPSSVGERLCRFLWQQPEVDLVKGSDLEFEPRVSYDYPLPAPKDQDAATTGRPTDGSTKVGSGAAPCAPLALEDERRADHSQSRADDRARPAPIPLGTFQRDPAAAMSKARPGGATAPVSVGKALASGSSSLLAAMAEEAHLHGGYGGFQIPQDWMGPPGRFASPPPGYYPPAGGFPPFAHYGAPQHGGHYPGGHPGPYGEAPRPPGFWGGPGTGQRLLGRPPVEWEGSRGRRGDRRSRSRKRHKKHK